MGLKLSFQVEVVGVLKTFLIGGRNLPVKRLRLKSAPTALHFPYYPHITFIIQSKPLCTMGAS